MNDTEVLNILEKVMYLVEQTGLMPYIQVALIVITSIIFIKILKD